MANDTRKGQKTNRKKVVADVAQAQDAAGLRPTPKARRPSRALKGSEVWLRKLRNTFSAKGARDIFDMISDPSQESLQLANKLLVAQTFLVLDAQKMLDKQRGKPGEESARAYLEDVRKNARMIKELTGAMGKLRAQYASENLDTNPDVIELIGVETFRSQLTTASSVSEGESVH